MHEIVMGLIGLSVTLLGALIVMVWRFSALATTLSMTVHELKEDLQEVRKMLDALKSLPVLESRLDQVEEFMNRMRSWWPKVESQIATIEEKIFSQQRFRARLESIHDDEEKKA
jgi:DNA repair ATPase RecN